jgi:hypoxanthine phosphoribosyltransferase
MKVLINEDQIHEGIARLARDLHQHYDQSPLTIVAIMTGSLVMLADLIRRLEMPIRISLIAVSSYRGKMTPGEIEIDDSRMLDIQGRDVLLIDDIFDTGKTLVEVTARLHKLNPRSIRTAVFLKKDGTSVVSQGPDFSVFDIPNAFVVGYGLDYQDLYRNLPYVGVLEESDLKQHPTH